MGRLSVVFSTSVYFSATLFASHSFTLPLSPLDSRSMGMGGTGVASSKTAHAIRFNPALLSYASSDEDFSLIIPQFGVSAADEQELFDSVTDFVDADYVDIFETSIDNIRAGVDNVTNDAAAVEAAAAAVNVPQLQAAVNSLNNNVLPLRTETLTVDQNTNDLIQSLSTLDAKAVRGKAGGGFALAFPSQGFAMGFILNTEVDFSGVLNVSQQDLDLLDLYSDVATIYSGHLVDYSGAATDLLNATIALDNAVTSGDVAAIPGLQSAVNDAETVFSDAETVLNTFSYGGTATPADPNDGDKIIFQNGELASDADDPELNSSGHFVVVATTEFGMSFSNRFELGSQSFSLGITPKYQEFMLYDYIYSVENDEDIDFDDVTDTETTESGFNIDLGYAQSFGVDNQWRVGAVVKNLIKQDYQTSGGQDIKIEPQIRAGLAYQAGMLSVAADCDITENSVVAFGDPTQYAMLGAELNVFKSVQLRVGYRTDLANSGFDSYSIGLGLSPFGVHLDIAGFVNTTDVDNEAGAAIEFGFEW